MLERLHIRNYRVFNDLKIDRLSRINLVAGKNNSGKTSLLEAIFLLAGGGNAKTALHSHGAELDLGSETGETLWKPMFFGLDMGRSIEIVGCHKTLGQLTLEISPEQPRATEISLDRTGSAYSNAYSDAYKTYEWALVFQYTGPNGQQFESRIRQKKDTFEIEPIQADFPFKAMILPSGIGDIREEAQLLGRLRKYKRGHVLLEALQVIEPRLQSIEDNSSSGTPMTWGDIGLPELIPLSAIGGGTTRIARLVLAIASTPDGVVLADEIENGLHHSVLPKVWQAVDATAKQFKTQVFATTHSFECIEAAHKALGADDFRLHRLEANGTENRCVTYTPEAIGAAIRHYMEVR